MAIRAKGQGYVICLISRKYEEGMIKMIKYKVIGSGRVENAQVSRDERVKRGLKLMINDMDSAVMKVATRHHKTKVHIWSSKKGDLISIFPPPLDNATHSLASVRDNYDDIPRRIQVKLISSDLVDDGLAVLKDIISAYNNYLKNPSTPPHFLPIMNP